MFIVVTLTRNQVYPSMRNRRRILIRKNGTYIHPSRPLRCYSYSPLVRHDQSLNPRVNKLQWRNEDKLPTLKEETVVRFRVLDELFDFTNLKRVLWSLRQKTRY